VCTVQYFVNTTHSREHESAARDTTSPGTSLFHRTPKHPVTALSPGFRPSLDTVQSIRSLGFLVFEPRRRRHAGGTVSFCHVLASVAVLPLWLPAYGARRLTLTHSFKPSRGLNLLVRPGRRSLTTRSHRPTGFSEMTPQTGRAGPFFLRTSGSARRLSGRARARSHPWAGLD
jgi:hypothetical protein